MTNPSKLISWDILPQILKFRYRNLYRTYLGVAMRDFAFSASGIFEPIYLYIIFQKLNAGSPLMLVAFFYAAFYLIFGFLSPLGGRLAVYIGFKWVALFSTPFRILYYILLTLLPTSPILIFPALLTLIIASTLYWPGFHVFFAHVYKQNQRATSISAVNIAGALASAVGPLAGGFIILFFGYPALFLSVGFFLIISVLFFWFAPNIKETYEGNPLHILKNILNKKTRRITVAFAAAGAEDQTNGILFPVFLFLIPLSYSSLGGVMTVSLMLTLLLTYVAGWASDKFGKEKVLKLGSVYQTLSWIARIFIKTPLSAAFIHGAYGFIRAFVAVPFSAMLYYDITKEDNNSYATLILREQALNWGRAAFLFVSGLFLAIYSNFTAIFIMAGVAALLRPLYIQGEEKITRKNVKNYIMPISGILTRSEGIKSEKNAANTK